jgi:Fanconi anemia group M protein
MAKRGEKSEVEFEKNTGGKPIIFLDDREDGKEMAERLRELGAEVKVKRLAVADAICSERVGVERKTDSDFEQSIVDGRLFAQAEELNRNFASPIICVVGKNFERMNPKALRGALIALAVDFRIPVHFFKNERTLATFLYQLAEREQLKPPNERRLRVEKKAFDLRQQQQFIVESLPMIGPKMARNLLEQFGGVEKIFTASEKELRRVKGVGKKRAKEIRNVAEAKYFEGEGAEGQKFLVEEE